MASELEPASGGWASHGRTDEDGQGRGPDLDEIVDRVVARIEQRVVDELERRGRRFTPGVF